MKKGQLTFEFLISLLVLVVVLSIFLDAKNLSFGEVKKHVDSLELKGRLEEIVSYCNLLYFNGNSIILSFSFNLSQFNVSNNTIIIEKENASAKSRCLANIGKSSWGIEVGGIRKWF